MSQRGVRARDVDRDAAIEIVEAAWADGQLTREEYEQRTDRLLRANALRDLEREIVDLQPEGTQWRPPGVTVAVTATPTTTTTPRLAAAAAVTAIVVAGLIMLSNRGADPSPSAQAAEVEPGTSQLKPASFVLAREELASRTGSDAVYSAVMTDDAIEFVHPTSAAGPDAVQVTWDGAWGTEQATSVDGERLSLGLVNAAAVSTIVADARRQGGDDADLRLVFQVERRDDRRICITATSSGNTTWSGSYDCQGREVGR